MHPLATAPYAATQAFVDGYQRRIATEHLKAARIKQALGSTGLEFWKKTAIEYAKKGGVRTMAAYAMFSMEDEEAGAVIGGNSIVLEAPLEGRDEQMRLQKDSPGFVEAFGGLVGQLAGVSPEDVERAKQNIAQNKSQEQFGLFVATYNMPSAQTLRKFIDEHPQVDGFLSLSRKERRKLLRTEQKNSGQ